MECLESKEGGGGSSRPFFPRKNKKNNSYFLLRVKLVQSKSQGEDIKICYGALTLPKVLT